MALLRDLEHQLEHLDAAGLRIFAILLVPIGVYLAFKLFQWNFLLYNDDQPLSPDAPDKSRRSTANMPPPFPNSWYLICESDDIKPGQVKTFRIFDDEIMVYREQKSKKVHDPQVFALDPYCPHLGAHIGHGGVVVGSEIQCPFHQFRYDGKGNCTHIPMSEGDPVQKKICLPTWTIEEVNGGIFVWYDVEHEAPKWHVPRIDEQDPKLTKRWVYHGKGTRRLACHIQDIAENGADSAHLEPLHSPCIFPFLPFIRHRFELQYNIDLFEPDRKHIANVDVETWFECRLFGKAFRVPFTFIRVEALQIGPGLVHLHYPTPFGWIWMIDTVTPEEGLLQRAHSRAYAEPTVPRFLVRFFLYTLLLQFDRDVIVWNNKKWTKQPLQSKADGPLNQYRRWIQQFYSKHGTRTRGKLHEW